MISVQSVYAGMERFGVDVGLASPPNHRRGSLLTDKHHHHHHRHHCHRCSDEIIRCPHHVSLPDGEWNQTYNSQFRNSYQQAEITRTYIRAPPNKSALEINLPVQKLNMSVSLKSTSKDKLNSPTQDLNIPITMSTSANSVPTTIHNNNNNNNNNNKSKHNPIAKFFTRISSVPTNNTNAVAAAAYPTKNSQFLSTDNHHQQTSPLSASLVCVSTSTSLSLLETTECPQTS